MLGELLPPGPAVGQGCGLVYLELRVYLDADFVIDLVSEGLYVALGYKVYDKVCVKVDTEFKVDQSATLAPCLPGGKEFAEHLK